MDSWKNGFPKVYSLEQAWEGCGWAEGILIDKPLLEAPKPEDLDGWGRRRLARRKRFWDKAERFFEENPEEYKKLLELGKRYKEEGWLHLI